MLHKWEILVGNVGLIYRGTNGFEARVQYNRAIGRSKRGNGRDANEPVTLFKDDEIEAEYSPVEIAS